MPSKLFPFAFCRDCDEIVAYELGEHEGDRLAQRVRCLECGSAITVLYDDGENVCCTDCGEIVPCLISHPPSTRNHRIEKVICVSCDGEIITFHREESSGRDTLHNRKP